MHGVNSWIDLPNAAVLAKKICGGIDSLASGHPAHGSVVYVTPSQRLA